MTNDDLKLIIEKVARRSVRNWVTPIDPDDLAQEIWLYVIDHHPPEWAEMLPYLRTAAKRCMSTMVEKEQFAQGCYGYGTKEIRKILKAGALKDPYCLKSKWVIDDLTEGLIRLKARNERYFETLLAVYVDEEQPASRRHLTRVVDALTQEMNRARATRKFEYKEGPGRRKVVSNSTSLGVMRSEYSGDPGRNKVIE